jgi:tetratricopeptide (TPR) repeat protein
MEAFVTHRRSLATLPAGTGTPVDMAAADFARFVDFLAANREEFCGLVGGEPTLHPDFPALVAAARRKQVEPVVETYGVVLDEVAEFLLAEQVQVCLRLLHPRFYDADQRARLLGLAERLGRREVPLGVVALAGEPGDDYAWVRDFLARVPCRQLIVRTAEGLASADRRRLAAWLAEAVPPMLAAGGGVLLDCGLQPCAFADDEYGRLARHGIRLPACAPRPGVDTALRVYHCREMVEFAGAPLAAFRKLSQVHEYFYRRHQDLQADLRLFPDCPPCPSRQFAGCQGPCMGGRARRLAAQAERLKQAVAADGSPDALLELGGILYELSRFGEAEQCLAEVRRLEPARGEAHLLLARTLAALDRQDEAEEEFRKTARLLPGGERALFEWAHRLRERGKDSRAHKIEDEARKMAAEKAADDKP